MQPRKRRDQVSICVPPMLLPATFQFFIAMVAYAINERMARRLDYVQEEVRVLREAIRTPTGKSRIAFTTEQRERLAIKGKALTPDERQGCCQLVRPGTILKWFRELAAKPYDGSKRRGPGRPRKPNELRQLVLRLANENVGWGYTKIRDALRGMKIEIGRTTVAAMLAEAGLKATPERTANRR
jgi:putative transposase